MQFAAKRSIIPNAVREVSLDEMLRARDERAERQRELLEKYGLPVLSITLNIAGGVKNTPMIRTLFGICMDKVRAAVEHSGGGIVGLEEVFADTGCEAQMGVSGISAKRLKAIACGLEERDETGRLYDIDIIDENGEKLSRPTERKCLICDNPVKLCARSRRHTAGELFSRANELIAGELSRIIEAAAYFALIKEVEATPKPGLVDLDNNGAHTDMDLELFRQSAAATSPFFGKMAYAVFTWKDDDAAALMKTLRRTGMDAEYAMLAATNGVNTHKGLIFSLGLLTAAAALCIKCGCDFDEIAPWVKTLVQSEGSETVSAATNGSRVYDKYGARGARGEAEGGYENAFLAAAAIERRLHDGMSENDAHVLSLMELTERMDDSNLLHRGGMDGLRFFKAESAKINALPESGRIERIRLFDAEAIKRNLSPGGAADMLCAGIFLNRIKNELF